MNENQKSKDELYKDICDLKNEIQKKDIIINELIGTLKGAINRYSEKITPSVDNNRCNQTMDIEELLEKKR